MHTKYFNNIWCYKNEEVEENIKCFYCQLAFLGITNPIFGLNAYG